MKTTLNLSRRFLPYGFAAEYDLECPFAVERLPELVDRTVATFWPILSKSELKNYKGRDASNLISSFPGGLNPAGDELFYLSGKLFEGVTKSAGEAKLAGRKELDADEFKVQVNTTFKEFTGSHGILHLARESRSQNVPGILRLRNVGRSFPLQPEHFRFGLDVFGSRFVSNMFGFAPAVNQTLLLEYTSGTFRMRILAEGLKRRDELPLQQDRLFDGVASIIRSLTSFDVTEDYSTKSTG